MFYYARSDTHYLLYIYDMIRNDVIKASDRSKPETDFIEKVVQKSRELSLSRYEGASFDAETGQGPKGWYNILLKNPLPLSGAQFAVYRALWKWRDETARALDESTGYVLPNSTIVDIARHMPPDAKALHSLIPNHSVIAKRAVNDIWTLFQEARARGANEPSLLAFFQDKSVESGVPRGSTAKVAAEAMPDLVGEIQFGRMERSQLYGDVPPSTLWEPKEETPPATKGDDYILLPWQRLVQRAAANGSFPTTTAPVDVEMADNDASAESGGAPSKSGPETQEKEESADEEFTLKSGVKRKKPTEDEEDTSSEEESEFDPIEEDTGGQLTENSGAGEKEQEEESDVQEEIELEDEEAQRAKEKAERKAAKAKRRAARKAEGKARQGEAKKNNAQGGLVPREIDYEAATKAARKKENKARKKEARAARKAAAQAGEKEETQVPFDYGKASSVLHANRDTAKTQGKKFDPYSKAGEEGPKGARKAPPLHGGRSATFKK